MAIPFRQLVQMITIDRGLCLFPRSIFDQAEGVISIFQFTKAPSQPIYIKPNLKAQGALGHGRKQVIPHVQIIRTNYVDQNRESNELIPDSLYDKLLSLKTLEDLLCFVEKWNINFVPNESDFQSLLKKYEDIGVTEAPVRYALVNIKPEGFDCPPGFSEATFKKIAATNIEFLWQKIGELRAFAEAWENGELHEHKLAWLNKELELVSPIRISYKGYALKKIRTTQDKMKETDEEIIGMRNAKSVQPLAGFRVYGHFALCALEMLHDMENGLQVFMCKNCGAIRKRDVGSKRKTCRASESEECYAERQRARQRKHRKNSK